MSHFTKVATKINDLVALKKALDQLGWKYQHAEAGQSVVVRGYKGATMNAEMSINMGKYDIAVLKQEDVMYTLEADWWGIETTRGITEAEAVKQINHQYAISASARRSKIRATRSIKTRSKKTGQSSCPSRSGGNRCPR